jgi:CelD/BcsL family acetyltransferase involved in cellulose biosynthesis
MVDQLVPGLKSKYKIDLVTTGSGLRQLKHEWDAVIRRSGLDHPFLDHAWITTWWECFGADQKLRILVLRSGGEVRAIAPLVLGPVRMYGLRIRRLGFPCNFHSPRCDFIVGPESPGVYRAIWDYISSMKRCWDVLELSQIPNDSQTLKVMAAFADDSGLATGRWASRGSPYLPIAGTWDAYLYSLRSKHRANLRNRRKRLERVGKIELEVVDSTCELDQALAEGFRIEAAAWKGQAGTAIASRKEVRSFYSSLAHRMAANKSLELCFLTVNGKRIAFSYSLRKAGKLYLLKQGYDPEFHPYSPSSQLLMMVLQRAFERGLVEYDFLGVDENWKREWTERIRCHEWLYTFSHAPRALLLHTIKFLLVPWIKKHQNRPITQGNWII